MKDAFSPDSPVAVQMHFEGCHADERMLNLCVETARCLGCGQRDCETCDVKVTQRAHLAEIRIHLETAEDRYVVSRLCPAVDVEQLRSSLRVALSELTRRVERSRAGLLHPRPRPRPDPTGQAAPPCIWQG